MSLTRTEVKVVKLVLQGASNMAMAESLGVGFETVKQHMANIFEKTGTRSRRELREKLGVRA